MILLLGLLALPKTASAHPADVYLQATYIAPAGAAYQVNAVLDKDAAITLGQQNRDSIQQSMTMDYVIGNTESAAAVSGDTETAVTSNVVENLESSVGSSGQAQ